MQTSLPVAIEQYKNEIIGHVENEVGPAVLQSNQGKPKAREAKRANLLNFHVKKARRVIL